MKGLFMKDLGLVKGQKQFFAAVLIVMTVFLMTSTSLSFVISYITVMMGMLTLTTIGYDGIYEFCFYHGLYHHYDRGSDVEYH